MFFKYQNYSNGQFGSPFAFAAKPLFILGIILLVLGTLIITYPEFFAGLVAFILYFLAGMCLLWGGKLWLMGKKMVQPPSSHSSDDETVRVDVNIIED